MNIPDLFAALSQISLLNGQSLAFLIILTALLIFTVPRWWGVVLLLLVQFFALGLILTPYYPPHMALTLWLAGLFTAVVLAFTARQLGSTVNRSLAYPLNQTNLIWRFAVPLLITAVSWGVSRWQPLQITASPAVSWVVWAFILLAAVQFIRPQPPLLLGIAFTIGLSGFGLWQGAAAQSNLLIGFWTGTVLLTALLTAFLMQRQPQPTTP